MNGDPKAQLLAKLEGLQQQLNEMKSIITTLQQPPAPPPPPPLSASQKVDLFFAELRADNVEEIRHTNIAKAAQILASVPKTETAHWPKVPNGIPYRTLGFHYFLEFCYHGLVDLNTTDTLEAFFRPLKTSIFETYQAQQWFREHVTPSVAQRLRQYRMEQNKTIVEWLCMSPCYLPGLELMYHLVDTTGEDVFPLHTYWNRAVFTQGDVDNVTFVKWWLENVLNVENGDGDDDDDYDYDYSF